jgi:hypothetical protein
MRMYGTPSITSLVFDRLLDEMLHGAARAGKKKRLETIRDLDAAALVLRDVARVVRSWKAIL